MKTFVFVMSEKGLRKCRVYDGELGVDEVKKHLIGNEKLVNWEWAHTCSF